MLTERIIRDAKPEGKTRIIWDGRVKGLGLRITANGVKSYILAYRLHGRQRKATLGRAGELALTEARRMAGDMHTRIRAGDDPQKRRTEQPTVAEAVGKFFSEFVPQRIALGKMAEKTAREYRIQWAAHLAPRLGRLKVAEVTRWHIEKVVEGKSGPTRNRLLALVSRLFNLFETWELRPQYSNPARGIERAREEARDRTLSPSELGKLAQALNQHEDRNPAAVAAIRVLAVTGLRVSEALKIKWEHIDLETGGLTLPSTKTGRRQHDLPPPALDVLTRLPRFCDWVFSATGRGPVTYKVVRAHFAAACSAAGIEGARLHDLRRTVMTRAAAAGIGVHVLRDLLGHKTTAMADRYVRAVGNPVKEAREQIGSEIAEMMGPVADPDPLLYIPPQRMTR